MILRKNAKTSIGEQVTIKKSEVKEENIEFSDECSCYTNDKYFSYRAEGTTGRFSGVLIIKE